MTVIQINPNGDDAADVQQQLVDAREIAAGTKEIPESAVPATTTAAITAASDAAATADSKAVAAQADATQALTETSALDTRVSSTESDISTLQSDVTTVDGKADTAITSAAQALTDAATAQEGVTAALNNYKFPMETGIVSVGDSITENGTNIVAGRVNSLGGRGAFYLDNNQGVAGDDASEILARIDDIGLAIQSVPDGKNVIVCYMSGMNDAIANRSADDYLSDVKMTIQKCFDYGADLFIAFAPYPPAATGTNAAYPLQAETWDKIDEYRDALATIDMDGVIVDTTSRDVMDDSKLIDGIHPNAAGMISLGAAQAETIKLALPPASGFKGLATSNNLLVNYELSGTGGSKTGGSPPTGDVADSWTAAGNISSVVMSKTDDAITEGRTCQTFTISATDQESNGITLIRQDVTIPAATTDDVYMLKYRYKLEAGSSGIANIGATMGSNFTSENVTRVTVEYPSDEVEGTVVTAWDSALAGGETSLRASIEIRNMAGDTNAVLHIESPMLIKVE